MSQDMPMRSEDTVCIHAGQSPDPVTGAVSVPIYQSSTFAFDDADQGADLFAGRRKGYIYTRLGNPTTQALETSLARLENGYGALATATGMAAVTTACLALLDQGTHLLGTASCYGASRTVIETEFSRFGISSDFVETSDLEVVKRALKPATRVILVESPANPTLRLTDIKACAALAKERGIALVVDNTFSSPLLQKPLDLGADVVLQSLTKFLNGHSDVVGGAIISKDKTLHERMGKFLRQMGGTMDPHQAWLVLRGIRTLSLRVHKSQENAERVAVFLERHPKVAWIKYPGLASHPDRDLAKAQMKGPGSMISFGLKGGFDAGKTLINNVKLSVLAVSLGGIESLIQHPASMTHAGVPREEKDKAGITDDLIRLSVGCEGVEDIEADLAQALDKVK
jgi:methionine-gamma-lyase